jgi:competence ComEA-like helix-hairpin-helix protein
MKDNYDFAKSYNRAILLLCLLVTVFYVLVTYIPKITFREEKPTISKPVYVEIATENESSYIIKLGSDDEVKKLTESYRLQRPLKNGDKLIITPENQLVFSRINGRKSLALEIPIGINSASAEDLVMLPGIGPMLAGKIIEYRKVKGRFENLYELRKVDGIGKKKFKSIRQLISLD